MRRPEEQVNSLLFIYEINGKSRAKVCSGKQIGPFQIDPLLRPFHLYSGSWTNIWTVHLILDYPHEVSEAMKEKERKRMGRFVFVSS